MGQALKIIRGLRTAMGIWVFETRIAAGSGKKIKETGKRNVYGAEMDGDCSGGDSAGRPVYQAVCPIYKMAVLAPLITGLPVYS